MANRNMRPQTGNKRVVIALQMAGKPGQRKMSGILDYLAEKDLRWEIRFVRHREDFSPDFVRALAANPIDGILYSFDTVPTVEAELAKIDIPTVGLDVFDQSPLCGRTRNLALVVGDCAAVGQAAADLLLDSGVFRRFAFVPDVHHRIWGKLRGRAFMERLKAHGFSADTYRRSRGAANDVAELVAWLKGRHKPCGVFVAFDDRALDVMEACRMAGVRVPQDVAVVSVDNDEMLCEHTVEHPARPCGAGTACGGTAVRDDGGACYNHGSTRKLRHQAGGGARIDAEGLERRSPCAAGCRLYSVPCDEGDRRQGCGRAPQVFAPTGRSPLPRTAGDVHPRGHPQGPDGRGVPPPAHDQSFYVRHRRPDWLCQREAPPRAIQGHSRMFPFHL